VQSHLCANLFVFLAVIYSKCTGACGYDCLDRRGSHTRYLGGSFAGSVAILFAITAYFPNRPPDAPSLSATVRAPARGVQAPFAFPTVNQCRVALLFKQPRVAVSGAGQMVRVEFGPGIRQLLGLRNWWLLASSYSVMTGISAAWASILSVVLEPVVYDSDEVRGASGRPRPFIIGSSSVLVSHRLLLLHGGSHGGIRSAARSGRRRHRPLGRLRGPGGPPTSGSE
jgi:hypothetical protein